MFDLTTRDIKYLSGVGPQRASVLNKELGIFSFHDLLYYFPYKYVDRSRIYYIQEIDGTMPYIQLKGEILGFETAGGGGCGAPTPAVMRSMHTVLWKCSTARYSAASRRQTEKRIFKPERQ